MSASASSTILDVEHVSLVYRRADAPPVVVLEHFRPDLGSWDPELIALLALDREVVLVDDRGAGDAIGVVPENLTEIAHDALAYIEALGPKQVDLLAFSLGGHVAQKLTVLRPQMVRRLVLVGAAPEGGLDLHRWADDVYSLAFPDDPMPRTRSAHAPISLPALRLPAIGSTRRQGSLIPITAHSVINLRATASRSVVIEPPPHPMPTSHPAREGSITRTAAAAQEEDRVSPVAAKESLAYR